MKRKILTVLLALSFLVLLIIGGLFYLDVQENAAADAALTEITEMKPELSELPGPPDKTDGPQSLPLMNFTGVKAENPDIIAWLTVPNTKIDYPVVQSKDNSYYLTRDAKKNKNANGALFLDYRVHADLSDFNNVIYGHHMKSGAQFQNLIKFKEQAFWDSHISATLYMPAHTYRLEIIAVAVVGQNSTLYEYAFPSPAERITHLDEIKSAAKFYRDVGVTENDRIVTLSTCSYEFNNARTVVIARLCD